MATAALAIVVTTVSVIVLISVPAIFATVASATAATQF